MLENVINCAALSSRDRGVTPGKSSMMGVVCVVTGATSGIGLETVVALASRGATVTAP